MKLGKMLAAVSGVIAAGIMSVTMLASADTLLPKEESQKLDYTTVQQQYKDGEAARTKLFDSISAKKDMPIVHITTQDKKKILSKEYYVESVVDVLNCDDSYKLSAVGGVRVRGNSTANQGDEKPYRIKFDKKQNMLGLHEGEKFKSWVLLRSFWNLCPDFTAFNLAKVLFEGQYYSSDCTYVNLYINGESRGVYLLCEQNQSGKGRVDVYEPEEDEYQTDIGYFVEMDNYAYTGEDPYFTLKYDNASLTDIKGVTRSIPADDFSIKSEINTQEQLDFIHKYMQGCFKILHEAADNNNPMMFDKNYNVVSAKGVYTPRQAVEAVFDCDSVVNMLLLEELCHDNDVGAGSFYFAVDFSEDSKYPKLTFTAPWDFNWAYEGGTSGYYAGTWQDIKSDNWDRSNVWLIEFMNADWFRALAADKWQRISKTGNITKALDSVASTIQKLRSDLGDSDAWRIDSGMNIVNFVKGRAKWLDKESSEWYKVMLNKNNATLDKSSYIYTGSQIKPKVTVRYGGKTLKEGVDYTLTYGANKRIGKGSVKVQAAGEFTGSFTLSFDITGTPIANAKISIPYDSYTYRGRAIKPTVTVTLGGKKLTQGTDYTFFYTNNSSVGTAKITVKGAGKYSGSVSRTFTVKPLGLSSSYAKVTIPYASYTYSGSEIKPAVKVKFKDGSLIPNGNYTLTYSSNVKVGIATITVKERTKNVTGTYTKTFVVKPAKNEITSISSTKGAFKISWKKATPGAVGYQVKYSTDKNFEKNVHSYTSLNLSDLNENFSKVPKSGETWYVKVRSFYTKDGKADSTRYGNYSAVKTIKVK